MRRCRTRDQETVRWQYRETLTEQATEMGTDPESPSGAWLIMLLPGPVSSYFIANAEGDNTGLYRSSGVDSVLDPGWLNTGTGFRRMTGDALRAIAAPLYGACLSSGKWHRDSIICSVECAILSRRKTKDGTYRGRLDLWASGPDQSDVASAARAAT
jgi:hypothetical protein